MGAALKSTKRLSSRLFPYLAITPAQLILFLVLVIPAIFTFVISFQAFTYGRPHRFVAWENYINLFKSPLFWTAFWHNIVFVNIVVYAEMLIGLGIAVLFAGGIPIRKLAVAIVMAPYAVSMPVAVVMWRNMLFPELGLIDFVLTGFGLPSIQWGTNGLHAFVVIVVLAIWLNVPFTFLILYNSIISIPDELIEAALVDGAKPWQVFRFVTFPLILPGMMVALTFRYIFCFRTFDIVWILTEGGPFHATELLSTYLYREAFRYYAFGTGASIGVVMIFVVLLISFPYLRFLYKRMFADEN